ncbi:hypothetical protein ACQKE8_13095 [Sphingobium limneticum]|uniref:hypothetical protein n=1 Tax=Sphingobium limneticum TaxID=1007511 RepID=UPI003D0350BD
MVYTTDLFEAVLHNDTVMVRCACGHRAFFYPNGLWWKFYRARWPYRYAEMRARFYCTHCLTMTGKRVRPVEVNRTRAAPVIKLPMPDERSWKRMIHSMRG